MENYSRNGEKRGRIGRFPRLSSDQIRAIQNMVKEGSSLRSVARQTNVDYSVVHRIAGRYAKKQMKLDLSALNERELGYIVGFFVGDGSRFSRRKSGHYGVKFTLDAKRDTEIASFLCNIFAKAGKQTNPYKEETSLIVKVYSQKLLAFLSCFVDYVEIEGRKRKMLVNFDDWPYKFRLGFMSGLIDSDGYVHRNKRGHGHFGADITTMNLALAKQLVDLFKSLGLLSTIGEIRPGKNSFNKRPTYIVKMSKPEFSKICSQLNSVKHKQTGCVKYFKM